LTIDREKILLAAQGFIQKKRYDKAVTEYQKIIQQDPDDARILLKIGDLQLKMEAYADAIATYERVGKHYASQGFALKAIAVYKQILETVSRHVPELTDRYSYITPQLADLYAQLGLISDALATYDEVATQLQRAGQDRRAIDVFQKIVALDTTNPLPHLRLAEAYSRVKEVDDAISHFATAADILIGLGRDEDAIKVIERLLHHRADPVYSRKAAELYLAKGKPSDGMLALAKLQICFQADPRNIETLTLLASAFITIGQPTKAIAVRKELARIAKDQGRFDTYRQTIEQLQKAAPDDEEVRRLVAAPAARSPSTQVSAPPPSAADSDVEELSASEFTEAVPSLPPQRIQPQIVPAARGGADVRRPTVSAPPEVEIVEEPADAEVPDDQIIGDEQAFDPGVHRAVLIDAQTLYDRGRAAEAIARLENGLSSFPQSLAIRRRLRDMLYEVGEQEKTAEQMCSIATILLEGGDEQGAAEELAAVLSFLPTHPEARQILIDLGYEVPNVDEGAPDYGGAAGTEQVEPVPPARAPADSVPLPSYDLEEVGATDAMSSPGYDVRTEAYERKRQAFEAAPRSPLPSFPLDEIPTALGEAAARRQAAGAASLPGLRDRRPNASAATRPASAADLAPADDALREALEEADFFMSRGLLEDARAILDEQRKRAPNHPLIVEKLRELDGGGMPAKAAAAAPDHPRHAAQARAAAPPDRAFDIAASLDALDRMDTGDETDLRPSAENLDVEDVFAKFKEGVKAQVSETDSATHYDLGLAYREMGLVPDAIEEFEVASNDPKRTCVCQSMIGMIHRSQGNIDASIDAFIKGLHAEIKTADQEIGLYYELGDAYESKGNPSEALYYFRKVAHRNPSYDDMRGAVTVRIRALPGGAQRQVMAQAVGATSDFDTAFDAAFNIKRK
jgi:tetratricopeptide (TPR) repeat protein